MLEVSGYSVWFRRYDRGLSRGALDALRDLSLEVRPGEVLAVIGESGSGKSLLAHAILGVLPGNAVTSGEMRFAGEPLTRERQRQLRGREIALIPQSLSSLNPLRRVGAQVERSARLAGASPRRAALARQEAFERYGLGPEVARLYPFQISGGMARRVLTAAAAVGGARLILADEPTNGLDREVARACLDHLRDMADAGKSVLLITHDIAAALAAADRVAVFLEGSVVETAPAARFADGGRGLRHPWSRLLVSSLPENDFLDAVAAPSGTAAGEDRTTARPANRPTAARQAGPTGLPHA